MSIGPPSSGDASLPGLPPELKLTIFDRFICDQEIAERHPATLANEALFDSSSLLNFCRASRRFCDIGLPILYRSVYIQYGKNLDSFADVLNKNPERAAYVKYLYYGKWPCNNIHGSHVSGHDRYNGLDMLIQVLQHVKKPQRVALLMPEEELREFGHRMCCLTAENRWPSPSVFVFQSYRGPEETNSPPQMVYIPIPFAVELTFWFEGPHNICVSPELSFPASLPRGLRCLNLEGISMNIKIIKDILKHCPVLEQLQWDLNTESWTEILLDDEEKPTSLEPGGQELKVLRLVNRDYHYELPESFLKEEVLSKPLSCFRPLAKLLEKLRVDLEGLARVTGTKVCLPNSLKRIEVVVACEGDFHRHWYSPDKDEYEDREDENCFDWGNRGEPRDTWLSLCFDQLNKAASSGQLPNLRTLVVNHELDSENRELVAATKARSQWKEYYEHYATMLGRHSILLSWTWPSEEGALRS